MGVIKGTLCGQYLMYVLHCMMSKAVWDAILGRLKMQNLGLAAHNMKQLLYSHPYLGGLIEDYLKHFIITNEHSPALAKHCPIWRWRIGCLKPTKGQPELELCDKQFLYCES